MAEKGDSDGREGGKNDSREGEVVKRGRGRPKKTAGGTAEAKIMKKFLENKEEVIFGKSSKIQHTPEKSGQGKQSQGEDGEEETAFTDGGMKASEGEGEKTDTVNEETDDDKEREGCEKEEEREGEASDDSKERHTRQVEGIPRDENSGADGDKEKEEKGNAYEGMSESVSESVVTRALVAKMSELEARLNQLADRLEKEERGKTRLEEKYKNSSEIVKNMEIEIAQLYEIGKRDRIRIEELENRLAKATKTRDENDNVEGIEVNRTTERVKGGEGGEKGEEGFSTAIDNIQDIENIEEESENSAGEGASEGGYEDRKYLHCIPTRLGEGERQREMEERELRKKNLMIRGIRTVGKGLKEEVKKVIKEQMGIEIYIKKVATVGGGLLVELESFSNKIDIIKRKGKLRGINLWIQDDFTPREKEVQEWLEMVAEEEGKRGHEVKTSYQKIMVDGEWYKWDEKKGAIEPMDFQEKRGEQKSSK